MSLLKAAMEECIMLDRKSESDGRGGFISKWEDGAEFLAAITYDTSLQGKVAEASGVKDLYTVTTSRSVPLRFHDIFRRVSDGQVLRVTSNGADNKTPKSAGLDMSQVSAEAFVLTGD